jgi:hypothetical protein
LGKQLLLQTPEIVEDFESFHPSAKEPVVALACLGTKAARIVEGWLVQMSPCLPFEDQFGVYSRIRELAKEYGVSVPRRSRLLKLWARANRSWRGYCPA